MSENNPNLEERQRMVDDAVRLATGRDPTIRERAPDELTRLFGSFNEKCTAAKAQTDALLEGAVTNGVVHTPKGRHQTTVEIHRVLVNAFREYNREECLFLLAWTHAQLMVAERV